MIDVILYVADFPALVSYLDTEHPQMLKRDEEGAMVMPPYVVSLHRTPAAMTGDELMVYVRLTEEQEAQWRGMPGVEVLAEAEFVGAGTGDAVYQQIFSDPAKYETYSRVFPHGPYEYVDPETGETMTGEIKPKFGVMAGA